MTSRELLPYNPNNQPLDEALKARFDTLLRSTAEQLEIFTTPDELTIEAKKVDFGKFHDGRITMAHIIDDSDHTGIVSVVSNEYTDRSFFVRHQIGTRDNREIWISSEGKRYSGRMVLRMLDSEWPTDDDTYPREQVRALLHGSAENGDPDVSSDYIFQLLEDYTFALRYAEDTQRATGEHSYEVQWRYHDVSANIITTDVNVESAVFDLISSENDALRQCNTDITVEHPINGVPTSLTYHINTNEAGIVTVTADYINPVSGRRAVLPLLNYHGILNDLTIILGKMVQEKSLVS